MITLLGGVDKGIRLVRTLLDGPVIKVPLRDLKLGVHGRSNSTALRFSVHIYKKRFRLLHFLQLIPKHDIRIINLLIVKHRREFYLFLAP